jgi:hypothetical protein
MNCWEFKQCGREADGARVDELGVCPAYPNHGRRCAHIAGTLCGGRVQAIHMDKILGCIVCEFFLSEHYKP